MFDYSIALRALGDTSRLAQAVPASTRGAVSATNSLGAFICWNHCMDFLRIITFLITGTFMHMRAPSQWCAWLVICVYAYYMDINACDREVGCVVVSLRSQLSPRFVTRFMPCQLLTSWQLLPHWIMSLWLLLHVHHILYWCSYLRARLILTACWYVLYLRNFASWNHSSEPRHARFCRYRIFPALISIGLCQRFKRGV